MNVKLGAELEVQKAYIAQRNAGVQADLSEAEPALLQAQESVRLIKRTQLDELRCEGQMAPSLSHTVFILYL